MGKEKIFIFKNATPLSLERELIMPKRRQTASRENFKLQATRSNSLPNSQQVTRSNSLPTGFKLEQVTHNNSIPTGFNSQVQVSELIETSKLLNSCASCRKLKKRCEYKGKSGEFRCERCKKSLRECLFQCTECYQQDKDEKKLSKCINCKTTVNDPSTEYSIVINADNQRPYLQHSNCDHKIEITSALLNDMTKSYEAVDRNYQAIDQRVDEIIRGQIGVVYEET
ncbi:hypothetical protein C2G38_2049170 [Gigaspora rosea]|uniref:Zn(2)-C6 fungal-type domain-containing protein n=1 Tax=Gigaspora rosea TaxID=44941 RepID=A0A397U8X4_9GLOM|nr:hypothetical protein C2G38_2049170 [Gigaspora rosea]